MLEDARKVPSGSVLDFDVCIVGSGAAGITLARSLDPKLTVGLLESGGSEHDVRTQSLYEGTNVGRDYFPLDGCRQRYFGGSTNCWAGLCRPLEFEDFTAREWVPHSGWPITRDDLEPYYARAHEVLRLGPYDYTPEHWATEERRPFALRAESDLRTGIFQINRSGSRVLGQTYRAELERSANVRVHFWANVTEIVLKPGGGEVDHLAVRALDGPSFKVRARHYVLAAGGLENPRLLLASRSVRATGVGNEHDLVGRFFMEHPHTPNEGLFLAAGPDVPVGFYRAFRAPGSKTPIDIWGYLTVRAQTQERERMLTFAAVLLDYDSRDEPPDVAVVKATVPAFDRPQALGGQPFLAWLGTPSEQAPNPQSRVTLDERKDELGVPRLKLDWRLSSIDKYTLRRAHELVARELGAAGLGRLKLTVVDDDHTWPTGTNGGRHHMGTTRMHADPKGGVVDKDCVVHSVRNLSVAGSSVFTTSGAANPTLTIVALALRAAERLSRDLAP
jgi:choline dehydrogenase-like flavoprotein